MIIVQPFSLGLIGMSDDEGVMSTLNFSLTPMLQLKLF